MKLSHVGAVFVLMVGCPAMVIAEQPVGDSWQQQVLRERPEEIAQDAATTGDAKRGAILFFQPHMACSKCHVHDERNPLLAPDLTKVEKTINGAHLVEAILDPSKQIRTGFEVVSLVTTEGRTLQGIVVEESPQELVLRDPMPPGKLERIAKANIESRKKSAVSAMPAGQIQQLASRQQLLDLVRYLIELRDGGTARAKELQPDPLLIAATPLPEYENRLDHAGLIRNWNKESFKRGEATYLRVCANCHGTHDRPGSLPQSPRFAEAKLKNGHDPLAMYNTLTRGFGFMPPQTWMVPRQKYDVIHYLRKAYLEPHNPSQLAAVDDSYLSRLPRGDTLGPAPSNIEPWVAMDYGPSLLNTYEVSPGNLAFKGLAMRLDSGPGGVSRGRHWQIFDHDTLRMAAAWQGSGFIDWNGIHFNGRHQVHPKIAGTLALANLPGPGWAHPTSGTLDDPRPLGRDGKPYGPLPREWAQFRGTYAHGQRTVIAYRIGTTDVLESPELIEVESSGKPTTYAYARRFEIGPRDRRMTLVVATEVSASKQGTLTTGAHPQIPVGTWQNDKSGRVLYHLPAGPKPLEFTVWAANAPSKEAAASLAASIRQVFEQRTTTHLSDLTKGGPPRWPQILTTMPLLGPDNGPFATDVLTPPVENPWLAQMRLTGLDFFDGGDAAAVCTWDGDVWLVRGLSDLDKRGTLRWQRIASGLFQPLGLKILAGKVYVSCRDQIAILHDLNGDGETDYYECFNNDHQVTDHFHEFAMGLQSDAAGNLYYAKSARHALPAVVPQHGTLLRVSPDGSRTDILANGFRAANGVCLNPDGSFLVTDQEGHWNPKNRINWVTVDPKGPPKFYGNMYGYHDRTDASDAGMEPPLCWITNAFDRSPGELLWVTSDRWGPLKGSLLNLSYGYGKVFLVPHERVAGQMQGGLIELPMPAFPTGVMRGRFHPHDGQLYLCGMFAWAGSATSPGGLYRLRATGKPMHLPTTLSARKSDVSLGFTDPLDRASATDAKNYAVKVWSLKRTANYGSPHVNEHPLVVRAATLNEDGKTVVLDVENLAPTWCMEIKYALKTTAGEPVNGVLHNTIHNLGPDKE